MTSELDEQRERTDADGRTFGRTTRRGKAAEINLVDSRGAEDRRKGRREGGMEGEEGSHFFGHSGVRRGSDAMAVKFKDGHNQRRRRWSSRSN